MGTIKAEGTVFWLKNIHLDYCSSPIKETEKAYLFRIPKRNSTPGGGKVPYRDLWIAKSIMKEYDRKENKDSGEVIVWIGLPNFVRYLKSASQYKVISHTKT